MDLDTDYKEAEPISIVKPPIDLMAEDTPPAITPTSPTSTALPRAGDYHNVDDTTFGYSYDHTELPLVVAKSSMPGPVDNPAPSEDVACLEESAPATTIQQPSSPRPLSIEQIAAIFHAARYNLVAIKKLGPRQAPQQRYVGTGSTATEERGRWEEPIDDLGMGNDDPKSIYIRVVRRQASLNLNL